MPNTVLDPPQITRGPAAGTKPPGAIDVALVGISSLTGYPADGPAADLDTPLAVDVLDAHDETHVCAAVGARNDDVANPVTPWAGEHELGSSAVVSPVDDSMGTSRIRSIGTSVAMVSTRFAAGFVPEAATGAGASTGDNIDFAALCERGALASLALLSGFDLVGIFVPELVVVVGDPDGDVISIIALDDGVHEH